MNIWSELCVGCFSSLNINAMYFFVDIVIIFINTVFFKKNSYQLSSKNLTVMINNLKNKFKYIATHQHYETKILPSELNNCFEKKYGIYINKKGNTPNILGTFCQNCNRNFWLKI